MRSIILATAFVALAPLAFAQTSPNTMGGTGAMSAPPGTMGGMNPPGTMGGMNPPPRATASAGHVVGPLDPGNCGTPDEPRPCPPMPRNPLPYFPPNRQ